jgi:FAD:protein FMN transferase
LYQAYRATSWEMVQEENVSQTERVTLAKRAMGTRFELVLYGENESYLRATGEEAFAEVERLEAQLSLYRHDSDLTDLNLRAASETVPVDPRFFRILERAKQLWEESGGAFDPTVAPLMRCWGFVGGTGKMPTEEEIAAAREVVGMQYVLLDAENFTVRFEREGVTLDLGAIGKGYAIERAIEIIRDNEVESGLLHGGTSSIYALGSPPDAEGWTIAIQRPFAAEEGEPIAQVTLRNNALSVSAPHGKWFESEGRRYGHVLDPRTGYPTSRNLLAALVTDSPTDGDALTTALLTRGEEYLHELLQKRPEIRALLVVEDEDGKPDVTSHGIEIV